eukprot:UN01268
MAILTRHERRSYNISSSLCTSMTKSFFCTFGQFTRASNFWSGFIISHFSSNLNSWKVYQFSPGKYF